MSLAVGGRAEYRFSSGRRYTVEGGDVVYLPRGIAYTIITEGEYHHYTVNFTVDSQGSQTLFPADEICVLHPLNEKYYSGAFRTIAQLWGERGFGYKMRCSSILYGMLAAFAEEKFSDGLMTAAYRRIKPAKDYIDADPTREVSIELLSALCDMSKTNFRRAFLLQIGDTPLRYRDRRLLSLAKELLSSGFFSVAECAERCGFDDASYFGRFFKKHTGISPGEFKQRA